MTSTGVGHEPFTFVEHARLVIRITYEGPLGGEQELADHLRSLGTIVRYERVPEHPDIIRDEVLVHLEVQGEDVREIRRALFAFSTQHPQCRIAIEEQEL